MSEATRYVHLCWDLAPVTACGLSVESQASPLVKWDVPESRWTGPLGIADVTCLNCLKVIEENEESE